jgi:hypothetical protein
MPRKGRGGARLGKPGVAYGNRTDLNAQPVRTAPGQPYGAAKAQADAQRQMPLPQLPPAAAAPAPGVPSSTGAPELVGLYAPTMRPDEPVQAGLPIGPGEGPIAGPTPKERLQAIYRQYPYLDELGAAIARMR